MKRRFKESFYKELVMYANRTRTGTKATCKEINNKIKELSGLVSPEGALQILLENEKW